ncbi:MAG: hypothetical protein JNK02_01110 [Planctomycetes bacterium]|nr:hypothetical protein [Planctomycetota bacterium]
MLSALLLALLPLSDPPISVVSPKENQVVQRADEGPTPVRVEVSAPSGIGRLTASVRPVRGGAEVAAGELSKAIASAAGSSARFETTLQVPAGGWYRLAIQVDGIAGPVEVARVERFGVGEVFLVAGQSNSANSGEVRLESRDERVAAFDGKSWSLAADPLPGVQDRSDGGSPWPVCGAELVRAWNVPVAFASVGYGGSSIAEWQKDAAAKDRSQKNLYAGLLERAQAIGRFRAILWHQGESDANGGTSTPEYVARFQALRAALQKDLGAPVAWVVAQASFVPGCPQPKMDAVRAAQARLWSEKLALQGPDTDDLQGALRHSVDRIHFSQAGLEAHGKRWAERLVALFQKP